MPIGIVALLLLSALVTAIMSLAGKCPAGVSILLVVVVLLLQLVR